ncbi:MAG TPA: alpha/beta hydrolase [Xanthomonadales bacterium]|nr:alpha/beta hydrolase [Xanthomonadales bacterium]
MRMLIGLITVVASVYVLLALLLYLFQDRMVFLADMPGRALTASPADIGLAFDNVSILTRDEERLHGWYVPAGLQVDSPVAVQARGVVLFLHGNAGNISHRLDSIAIFHQLGLDTLIIDYRGYGESSGRPSEAGTYLDAQAAWDYLVNERQVAAEQIIVFGRSLGGAVGTWLASRSNPAAVIIESSFTSGVDMARRLYPVFPARLITRIRYPVVDYVGQLRCPVLVVHSRDDEIIPFAMGQALFAASPEPKTLLELRGDHNNGFFVSREDYVAGLEAFIGKVLSR